MILGTLLTAMTFASPIDLEITDGPGVKNIQINGEPAKQLIEHMAKLQKGETVGDTTLFTWYSSNNISCAIVSLPSGEIDSYFCQMNMDHMGNIGKGTLHNKN